MSSVMRRGAPDISNRAGAVPPTRVTLSALSAPRMATRRVRRSRMVVRVSAIEPQLLSQGRGGQLTVAGRTHAERVHQRQQPVQPFVVPRGARGRRADQHGAQRGRGRRETLCSVVERIQLRRDEGAEVIRLPLAAAGSGGPARPRDRRAHLPRASALALRQPPHYEPTINPRAPSAPSASPRPPCARCCPRCSPGSAAPREIGATRQGWSERSEDAMTS